MWEAFGSVDDLRPAAATADAPAALLQQQSETLLQVLERRRSGGARLSRAIAPARTTTTASFRPVQDAPADDQMRAPSAPPVLSMAGEPAGAGVRPTLGLGAGEQLESQARVMDDFASMFGLWAPEGSELRTRTHGVPNPSELARRNVASLLNEGIDGSTEAGRKSGVSADSRPSSRHTAEDSVDRFFARASGGASDAARSDGLALTPGGRGANRRSIASLQASERRSSAPDAPRGSGRSILDLDAPTRADAPNPAARPSSRSIDDITAATPAGSSKSVDGFAKLLEMAERGGAAADVPAAGAAPSFHAAQRNMDALLDRAAPAPVDGDHTGEVVGQAAPSVAALLRGDVSRHGRSARDKHSHPLADDAVAALEAAFDRWRRAGHPPCFVGTIVSSRVRCSVALLHCRVASVARDGDDGADARIASTLGTGDEIGLVLGASDFRALGLGPGGRVGVGPPVMVNPPLLDASRRVVIPSVIWAGSAVVPLDDGAPGAEGGSVVAPFRYNNHIRMNAQGTESGSDTERGPSTPGGGLHEEPAPRPAFGGAGEAWEMLDGFPVGPAADLGWGVDLAVVSRLVALRLGHDPVDASPR